MSKAGEQQSSPVTMSFSERIETKYSEVQVHTRG